MSMPFNTYLWQAFSLAIACQNHLAVIYVGDYQPHLLVAILMGMVDIIMSDLRLNCQSANLSKISVIK